MYLCKDHFVIRNATNKDADILMKWWNDGNIMEHAGFFDGLGITKEEIIYGISQDHDDIKRRLIIEEDNTPIGEMCIYNRMFGTMEIAIKICDVSRQNKGIGKIVLSMLIKHLFERGYKRIILDTDLNNLRAQHVYERLGFRKIRTNIDSWKDQRGNLRSSVDYALIQRYFIDFS